MEASAELANSSVNALLSDSEEEEVAAGPKTELHTESIPHVKDDAKKPSGATVEMSADGRSASTEMDGSDQRPLKSPFEEFAPPKIPPQPPVVQPQPHRNVRFNGGLESFSEEPEGQSSKDFLQQLRASTPDY